MRGKNKCKILKQIRQKIADENDIPYVTRECTYQGECKGTCPKCEAELRYLEQELERRRSLGKAVAVAAVAAGLTFSLTACVPKSPQAGSGTEPMIHTGGAPDEVLGNIETCPPEETQTAEPLEGEIAPRPFEQETTESGSEAETEELLGDVDVLPPEGAGGVR